MREYILCAANYYDDGKEYVHQPKNITTGYVWCGRRHHNIINLRGELLGLPTHGDVIQGFLTSSDRFVDREEAAEIAFKSGQIDNSIKTLYSEDLY
jgi:hypothetical protein